MCCTLSIIVWLPLIKDSVIVLSLLKGSIPDCVVVVYLFHFKVNISPGLVPSNCSFSALTKIWSVSELAPKV